MYATAFLAASAQSLPEAEDIFHLAEVRCQGIDYPLPMLQEDAPQGHGLGFARLPGVCYVVVVFQLFPFAVRHGDATAALLGGPPIRLLYCFVRTGSDCNSVTLADGAENI